MLDGIGLAQDRTQAHDHAGVQGVGGAGVLMLECGGTGAGVQGWRGAGVVGCRGAKVQAQGCGGAAPGESTLDVLVGIGDQLLDAGQQVGHDHLGGDGGGGGDGGEGGD